MRIILRTLILGLLCEIVLISCSPNRHPAPVVTSKAEHIVVPLPRPPENEIQIGSIQHPVAAKQPVFVASSMLAALGPQSQLFHIPAAEASVIICAQGSTLQFDANSIVYADSRQPVVGSIDISVTEYLSDAAFVLAGLSTISNKKLLESGGMINVTASAQNRPCELAENAYYEVSLPNTTERTDMQVFYSDMDGKNWQPANRGTYMEYQNINTYSESYINPLNNPRPRKYSYEAQYPGGITELYAYLNKKVHIPEAFQDVTLKATCYVNITVNDQGKIMKVHTPKQIATYADKEIIAAFKSMPLWDVDIAPGMTKKLMLPVKLNFIRDPSQISIKEKTLFQPERKRFTAKYESDKYIMTVGELGWINCDKFVYTDQPRITAFIPADSTSDMTVTMVFHSLRSVIGGMRYASGFYFDNIPSGEKITLVAVRINENGNTELAMKETTVNDEPITDLAFIAVTKSEMLMYFEQLTNIRATALAGL